MVSKKIVKLLRAVIHLLESGLCKEASGVLQHAVALFKQIEPKD